jgi:hypothetical protein
MDYRDLYVFIVGDVGLRLYRIQIPFAEYIKKNKGLELVRLFDLYGRMSKTNKGKFLRCAEKMGK